MYKLCGYEVNRQENVEVEILGREQSRSANVIIWISGLDKIVLRDSCKTLRNYLKTIYGCSFLSSGDIFQPNQDCLAKGIDFSRLDLDSQRAGYAAGQWYSVKLCFIREVPVNPQRRGLSNHPPSKKWMCRSNYTKNLARPKLYFFENKRSQINNLLHSRNSIVHLYSKFNF